MVLGLTGGIGSGKSVVAKILETMGCIVFNSDAAAGEIYFDPQVKAKVIRLLGPESYLSGTTLDKKYISAKIFENTGLLFELNKIIHPVVSENFKKFVATNPAKTIIKESALLFEANVADQVDKVIIVTAKDEVRIKRVMKRDGLSRKEVLMKMKSQMSQEEKIKKSDFVIDNNENEFLVPQVLKILKKLDHA